MVIIYANIWGILMVNVTIYSIHGSYGKWQVLSFWGLLSLNHRLKIWLHPTPALLGHVRHPGKRTFETPFETSIRLFFPL